MDIAIILTVVLIVGALGIPIYLSLREERECYWIHYNDKDKYTVYKGRKDYVTYSVFIASYVEIDSAIQHIAELQREQKKVRNINKLLNKL